MIIGLMMGAALVAVSFATSDSEAIRAARERQKPYARAAGVFALLLFLSFLFPA